MNLLKYYRPKDVYLELGDIILVENIHTNSTIKDKYIFYDPNVISVSDYIYYIKLLSQGSF